MSKSKKSSKRTETKATIHVPSAVAIASQPLLIEAPIAPRIEEEPPTSKAGKNPEKNIEGLSLLKLCTLLVCGAILLAVLTLYWSISNKLQKKAGVEQVDKLTTQVSRLTVMLEESLRNNKAVLDASLKASRLDQRAWVGVKSIQMFTMEVGKPLQMEIKFSNSGKTFALDVRHTGILRLSDKPLGNIAPEDRENLEKLPKQVPTLVTLAPSGESLIPCASLAPITEEMIDAINTGKVHVYLVGEISYSDVFKQWHTTRFFQHYVPAEQKFMAEQSHNDAD